MMVAVNHPAAKTLGQLLPGLEPSAAALPVAGLALDSRELRPGDVFLAYPGAIADGRSHIAQALAAGAAVVVAEADPALAPLPVPLVQVRGLRDEVSRMADRFYGGPSAALDVIGVTGTNGKTSCTQLLGQALRLAGHSCGVIGTLGCSLDGSISSGSLTTPDPIALQRQLAEWRGKQVGAVAMEVSSHGLAQGRVNGVTFRGAVFTNLSRDHLDFHGSMSAYADAKAQLFEQPGLGFAAINLDDEFGRTLVQRLQPRLRVLAYSLQHETAAVRTLAADYRPDGISARLATPWGELAIDSQLLGDFNLSNLLAVVAVLGELGLAAEIEALVPKLRPIAGRMERVPVQSDIEVVVDYAHTPDALEHALTALRQHCRGRLWCVFGCGGDRDRGKRPLMGQVAERLADRVVLTSDNPRSEQPEAILNDILLGTSGTALVESDRAAALQLAIGQAQPGDIVLVAGKGHEDYQIIGQERRPFSDAQVARVALLAREGAA